MGRRELKALQAEEDERVVAQRQANAKTHPTDLARLVRGMYDDLGALPDGHAYHRSGSLGATTLVNEATIVEVFPYRSLAAFEGAVGLSVNEVVALAREGIVRVLIHSYPAYDGLDFLMPILELRPATYQARGEAILDIVGGGRFPEWFERAVKGDLVKNVTVESFHREPYEREQTYSAEEVRRKTAWRYAALCCLMGEEVIDEVVARHGDAAAHYLNELHTEVLHPITHGMMGEQFNELVASRGLHLPEYVRILDSIERIVISDAEMVLPQATTAAQIIKAHEKGVVRSISAVRKDVVREVMREVARGGLSAEAAERTVRGRLLDLKERVSALKESGKMVERGLVFGLLAGGTACLGVGLPTLSALLYGTMAATPYVIEPLARTYARICEPTVSHYWRVANRS